MNSYIKLLSVHSLSEADSLTAVDMLNSLVDSEPNCWRLLTRSKTRNHRLNSPPIRLIATLGLRIALYKCLNFDWFIDSG